jgi:hypothetical protein
MDGVDQQRDFVSCNKCLPPEKMGDLGLIWKSVKNVFFNLYYY